MSALLDAHHTLNKRLKKLRFAEPVAYVYNPLEYAAKSFERYLKLYGRPKKKAVFLGMNPGPFGMAQTGVPFGEIRAVREWMGIEEKLGKLPKQCPKRPILGFDCTRSEVSGRRLWGLFEDRYPEPKDFFRDHFVLNYCPLVFMEEGGKNITPDKLAADTSAKLFKICDDYLKEVLELLSPKICIGVGAFAEKRLKSLGLSFKVSKILHPSPASPAANRGWAEQATAQMTDMGLWSLGR